MTSLGLLPILVARQGPRAVHHTSRGRPRDPENHCGQRTHPPIPSEPGRLHTSLGTPLERIVVEHAELVEAVRRRVVTNGSVPSDTVPVAAFNSSI